MVCNNPVPKNYTKDCLKLLKNIADCKNDEVVRTKPVTMYLNRKWNATAYKFYLVQLVLYMTHMMSLLMIEGISK